MNDRVADPDFRECAGCRTEITQAERDADDVAVGDDEREYHWACLQERYELDRLAEE